jgi:hypothetical protein
MPRRSIATAPLGGGSLASSELISTVADAGAETDAAKNGARIPKNNASRQINDPSLEQLSTRSTIPDDGIRRPRQRMSVSKFGFAVRADIARTIDQRHHGLT